MNLSATHRSGGRRAASSLAMAELAGERAALYRLLATLFRGKPSLETLEALRTPELREALGDAGMTLPEEFFEVELKALTEELAVAFTDLFLLPGSLISPHESVQLKGGSGLLRGPETAAVRDYYKLVGFEVDDSTPMEPDHISIEMEFLGHLAAEEAGAWESENAIRALDALRYQNEFLNRHMGRWVNDFAARIERSTQNAFYRQLATLTADLFREQQAEFPALIAGIEERDATPKAFN